MADEPRFPAPDEARRKPETPLSQPLTEPSRTVVTRAEAPPHEAAPGARAPVKLTADEMRALLAVDGASRPSNLKTSWRRVRLVSIPTGVIGIALHLMFGSAGEWAGVVLTLVAMGWVARPLLRPLFGRDGW